jgi:hypothetical protein
MQKIQRTASIYPVMCSIKTCVFNVVMVCLMTLAVAEVINSLLLRLLVNNKQEVM